LRGAAGSALAHRRAAGEVIAPRPPSRPGLAAAAGAVLCVALAGCTADWARIPAQGEIEGRAIDTTVDAPIARYYLENSLPGRHSDPDLDRRISAALAELPEEPRREAFQELAAELSVDLATMHLIKLLLMTPRTRG